MKPELEVRYILSIFSQILERGVPNKNSFGETEHTLNGLTAHSSFDGYVVTIKNEHVSLSVQFHNTFKLDFLNEKYKQEFLEKLQVIHAQQ